MTQPYVKVKFPLPKKWNMSMTEILFSYVGGAWGADVKAGNGLEGIISGCNSEDASSLLFKSCLKFIEAGS